MASRHHLRAALAVLPDLNGQLAECAEWLHGKERYRVRLLGSPVRWDSTNPFDFKAVRKANLRLPNAFEKHDPAIAPLARHAGHPQNQHRTAAEMAEFHAMLGQSLRQFPWSAVAHAMLGDSAHGRGDMQAMRAHYQRAVANSDIESDPLYARGLAVAETRLEMRSDAIRTLGVVLTHAPTDALSLLNLAKLMRVEGQPARSVPLFSAAIEHAPSNSHGAMVREKALSDLHALSSLPCRSACRQDALEDREHEVYDIASAAAQAYTHHASSSDGAVKQSYCFWVIGVCKERQADAIGGQHNLLECNANLARVDACDQHTESPEEAELIQRMLALYVGVDYDSKEIAKTGSFHPGSAASYFVRALEAWHGDSVSEVALAKVQAKALALRGHGTIRKMEDGRLRFIAVGRGLSVSSDVVDLYCAAP